MDNIGLNIRKLRETSGMSQDQLGARIGKTRSAISQYESGKIVPRMDVINDIADVFRVPTTEILEDKNGDGGLGHNELSLLDVYRELPESGKDALMRIARDLYEAFVVLKDDNNKEV